MIPDFIEIPGAKRKVLPPGRYGATLDEIQKRFVPDEDSNRQAIFTNLCGFARAFEELTGSLLEIWIGGSFITSENHPHDVDAAFLFRTATENFNDLPVDQQEALRNLCQFGKQCASVHAFPLAVPRTGIEDEPIWYMKNRGYWDQLWSKCRMADLPGNVKAPPVPYPLSGYLVVSIDG